VRQAACKHIERVARRWEAGIDGHDQSGPD
jgi:hypothetical protein